MRCLNSSVGMGLASIRLPSRGLWAGWTQGPSLLRGCGGTQRFMADEKVAIVIPALNEEAAIRQLLAGIPPASAQWIVVVDNGSTDGTAAVARAMGALIASEPARGYGRACLKGFKAAVALGAEVVIFMDGDGSDDPADLPMMLAPVSEGRADFVIGSRVSECAEPGAVPPQARLGNWLVSRMISRFYDVRLHDIGSFRAL